MINKILDHAQVAVDNFLSQFSDKPLLVNLLRLLVEPDQHVEDTSIDLILERQIDTADGAQLDQYGKIVGAARRGLSDDDYRKYIRIRIEANRANGTANTILNVVSELVGAPVKYDKLSTAAYRLQWQVTPATSSDLVALLGEIIPQMTGAGIGYDASEALPNSKQFDTASRGFDGPTFGALIISSE